MNFDEYCQQKAAPPGSSTYYALRQAPAASQPRLTALFALRREFEETVKEVSDPAIGRTKLAWWQNELGALASGSPTHPVSKALAASLPDAKSEYPALQTLLRGFEMDLDQARYLDYPNLRRYVQAVGGTFAALVARAASNEAATATEAPAWSAPLGEALLLAQLVVETGNDARRGRIYIPIDEMQRFNVTAADLINRKYTDAFTELMRFETKRARDALHAALAAVPGRERRAQRTLLAQGALASALLDEIERDGYHVLHQRIALTPIRKLWIAWRAK
ncbi:squalene/phytoene synthase family protein [Paraburkholderia phenoliruptrix]|uniref:squalene/phytoene synthase family protein n=1 Tax=Paraburkholderia phenoliruptrix TaxID=252970 RepID=UPI001C6EA8C3|nr:squalene/phytoene synthase family protein [Paraburkholderia phenoliruptrix]MBW9130593.1 squalene/phytoene synthase family protein [Paraburkholderia ginsengiterrae]